MSNITFAKIICALRERMIEATKQNDRQTLGELMIAFLYLKEVTYETDNPELSRILQLLEDSARDASIGESWKSSIPSVEAIKKALSET